MSSSKSCFKHFSNKVALSSSQIHQYLTWYVSESVFVHVLLYCILRWHVYITLFLFQYYYETQNSTWFYLRYSHVVTPAGNGTDTYFLSQGNHLPVNIEEEEQIVNVLPSAPPINAELSSQVPPPSYDAAIAFHSYTSEQIIQV